MIVTEENRAKREAKAIKSKIQREKDEKREREEERAEEMERREVIRKADKKEAKANQRKDKEEAWECNKIA